MMTTGERHGDECLSASERLRTPICERLGIAYPVFQAGMGWVARGELAAAVSEAGGLGVIGAGSTLTPDELRQQIRVVKSRTDKPFGVDILFATVRASGSEVVRYTDAVRGMVDVVLEERVPVLISGLGSPKGVIPQAHACGIVVMSVVGAVRHAVKAVSDCLRVRWRRTRQQCSSGSLYSSDLFRSVGQALDAVHILAFKTN